MSAAESRSTLIGDRSGWADADGLGLEQGRLMQAVLRMAVMAAGSSIGIGLLVLWLVHPVMSGAQRWMLLWPVGLAAAGLLQLLDVLRSLGWPLARLAQPAVRWRLIGHSVLTGLMFAAISVFIYPQVDAERRYLLGMIACAAIPIGAMAGAPLRWGGMGWTLVTSAGVLLCVLQLDGLVRDVSVPLTLLMAVLVMVSLNAIGRSVRHRLQAEATARRERHALDLLLRDFEQHADDWLWETDAHGRLRRISSRMAQALGVSDAHLLIGRVLIELLRDAEGSDQLARHLSEPEPFRALARRGARCHAAARAVARAAASGPHRCADRSGQSPCAAAPLRRGGGALPCGGGRPFARGVSAADIADADALPAGSRQLQGDQRHPRPCGRRPPAARGRAPTVGLRGGFR